MVIGAFLLVPVSYTAGATVNCVLSRELPEATKKTVMVEQLESEGYVVPKGSVCAIAQLSGPIEDGDADQLETLVIANLPFLSQVELNSRGGSVAEAMKIGRLARRYYLKTNAPSYWIPGDPEPGPHWHRHLQGAMSVFAPGAVCASSCFFAWLGGVTRSGDIIGIHRPFPPINDMQRMSPDQAGRLYRNVSDTIRTYLAEVEASAHWLDDMMKISSDDILMLSQEQLSELTDSGPPLDEGDVPSIVQWKAARCGSLTATERQEWRDMFMPGRPNASVQQELYREKLQRHAASISTCGFQALMLARWRVHTLGGRN